MRVVKHGGVEHQITQMTRSVESQVIKAQANNTFSLPILKNLWIINRAPANEVAPSKEHTDISK